MVDLPKQPLSVINPLARPRREQFRNAIEAAAANGGEGWILHQDSARKDRADGVTIAANTRAMVQIDGLGSGSLDDLDTIPRATSGTTMLENSAFMPIELNDNYLIRFGFSAAMIDPGLSTTEDDNSILVEYDVNNLFTVHQARKDFSPTDVGPARRERNNMATFSPLLTIAAAVTGRLSVLQAILDSRVSAQETEGQKFIEFGQAFAGQPVVDSGVRFFVTPTTDIILWGADLTITRLSSPTT